MRLNVVSIGDEQGNLVYLTLRKITKFVATRCQILRLKYAQFNFGWGSAPDPAGEAYSAPPDRLAGFKRPTSKGREAKAGKWEGKREGEERSCLLYTSDAADE